MRPGRKILLCLCLIAVSLAMMLASSIGLFLFLEWFPSARKLVNATLLRYYDLQERYELDEQLVFKYRQEGGQFEWQTNGDLFSPAYQIEPDPINWVRTYRRDASPINLSDEPYSILFIGDSFIESDETDGDTLSERVAAVSGLSTFNLGRGWYGPYQYLNLLGDYADAVAPECAVFSFFSGNDVRDIAAYEDWRRGGSYYEWPAFERNIFDKYRSVVQDLWRVLRSAVSSSVGGTDQDRVAALESLARVDLGTRPVPMVFAYRDTGRTAQELLETAEWHSLRTILRSFRDAARGRGIQPVVLFIPTKFEVYAHLVSGRSGRRILEEARAGPADTAGALEAVARDLNLPFIDLLAAFRARAEAGDLLYYPFDSHWNSTGRQVAAEAIARWLQETGACTLSEGSISPPPGS